MSSGGFEEVSREELRMYHAIKNAVGKELADKMFPHIGRFLLRVDATTRRTTGT